MGEGRTSRGERKARKTASRGLRSLVSESLTIRGQVVQFIVHLSFPLCQVFQLGRGIYKLPLNSMKQALFCWRSEKMPSRKKKRQALEASQDELEDLYPLSCVLFACLDGACH